MEGDRCLHNPMRTGCGGGIQTDKFRQIRALQDRIAELEAQLAARDREIDRQSDRAQRLGKRAMELEKQLAEARNRALEEAASLADSYAGGWSFNAAGELAAAIRALKDQ